MAPSRMSKRAQKDLRRLRREEDQFRARRRRFRQNLAVIGGAVVVALVVLGLVALSIHNRGGSGSSNPSTSASPSAGSTGTATTPVSGSPTGTATPPSAPPATIPSTPAATPTASGSPAR